MQRDTTRALALLKEIGDELQGSQVGVRPKLLEVQHILVDMDARTGKRDPSKRRAAKKRATKR